MMPTSSRSRTSSETARTAVRPPKRLVTFSSVSTRPSSTGRPPRAQACRDSRQALGSPADDQDERGAVDDEIDAGEARLHAREGGSQVGLEHGDEDGPEVRPECRADTADDRVEGAPDRQVHREHVGGAYEAESLGPQRAAGR